jgi:hypothetical protein
VLKIPYGFMNIQDFFICDAMRLQINQVIASTNLVNSSVLVACENAEIEPSRGKSI